jgi:hypothetical protein
MDGAGLVARVDGEPRDGQVLAAGVQPGSAEQVCQLLPAGGVGASTFDHHMIDKPGLEPAPPGPDIDLDPVLLHVGPGRQEEPARRHGARLPRLPPVMEPLPVGRLAGLDPGLAENGVPEGLAARQVP